MKNETLRWLVTLLIAAIPAVGSYFVMKWKVDHNTKNVERNTIQINEIRIWEKGSEKDLKYIQAELIRCCRR